MAKCYFAGIVSIISFHRGEIQVMNFNMTTGYAVGVMAYMSQSYPQLKTAKEIAEEVGVTPLYLIKILHRLLDANLLSSEQGRYGGYRLSKEPEKTFIYDIVIAMEKRVQPYAKGRRVNETAPAITTPWFVASESYFRILESKLLIEMKKTTIQEFYNQYM